jgi:hypothetical protein
MNNTISIDSEVVRVPEIIFQDLDGDTVMMNLERGEYYSISQIGSRIWQLIEIQQKVSAVCNALMNEYNVTPEQCEQDVLVFLNQMAEKGIVRIAA